MSIDIQGLDKAELLTELYNNAHHVGVEGANHEQMSVEDAHDIIEKHGLNLFTIGGRALHVDLSGDTLDSTAYNRSNGHAAAEHAVETVHQRNPAVTDEVAVGAEAENFFRL